MTPDQFKEQAEKIVKGKDLYWCEKTLVVQITQALHSAYLTGRKEQREVDAKLTEISSDELRLRCGEMTVQEMRTVKAVLKWITYAIRNQKLEE